MLKYPFGQDSHQFTGGMGAIAPTFIFRSYSAIKMKPQCIQPPKGWATKKQKVELASTIGGIDVFKIVTSIDRIYPYLKHSNFSTDSLVCALIYAEITPAQKSMF